METSRVTASAPWTERLSAVVRRVPPSGSARSIAAKRSAPGIASYAPFRPRMASVSAAGASGVTGSRLWKFAVKEILPGWSAVSRTTITWSGAEAKSSRR